MIILIRREIQRERSTVLIENKYIENMNIIFQLDNESRMRSLRRSTFLSKLHVQRGNGAWFGQPATPSAIPTATQPAEDVQPE